MLKFTKCYRVELIIVLSKFDLRLKFNKIGAKSEMIFVI